MKPIVIALAGAALAGGTGVTAVPAGAVEPDSAGTYTFSAEDGQSATWTLTPCPDDADMCMRVSETGNAKRAPWSGDAHYAVGSWILFVQQPDAILCPDGSTVPGLNTYSWEAVGLSGSVSINSKGACGAEPGSVSIPFTLNRIGPPPIAPPAPPPEVPAVPPPDPPPDPVTPPATADAPLAPAPADAPDGPEAAGGPLSAESPVEPPAPAPAQPPAPPN